MLCKIGGEQTWSSALLLCHYDEQALAVVMVAIKARLTQADTVWHMIMVHNFKLWTADYPPPFCSQTPLLSPPSCFSLLNLPLHSSAFLLPSPTFHTNNSEAKDTLPFIILYIVTVAVCCALCSAWGLLPSSVNAEYNNFLFLVTKAVRSWPWLFSYRCQAWTGFSRHWTTPSESTSRPKSRRSVTKNCMLC